MERKLVSGCLIHMLHFAGWWRSRATRRERSRENDTWSLRRVTSCIPFNWKVCLLFISIYLFIYVSLKFRYEYSEKWNLSGIYSKLIRNAIADCLPDRSLAILVPVLDRFVVHACLRLIQVIEETWKIIREVYMVLRIGSCYFQAFHLSLNMITPETHKAVSEVIESCRGGWDFDKSPEILYRLGLSFIPDTTICCNMT